MIEFSRRHQEDKLSKEQEQELRQLTEDEVDLEVGDPMGAKNSKCYFLKLLLHRVNPATLLHLNFNDLEGQFKVTLISVLHNVYFKS